MNQQADYVIGLEVGTVGRWFRLIIGLYVSVLVVVVPLVEDPIQQSQTLAFLGQLGIWFLVILVVYLVAFYFLGERILAVTNPWIGTLIFLGPVALVGIFNIGPTEFQVALGLYYAVSSVFNFAMSYGGCEVIAIPSLIFRRRYTVYCPYNAVDVVEKALLSGSPRETLFGVVSFAITVFVGGYFLLVEDQNVLRHFFDINLANQWALLLLIPIAYIGRNGWSAYVRGGRQFSSEVQTYAIGGLVLALLTVSFVLGTDALPLWYAALILGGFFGIYTLVKQPAS